MVSRFPIDGLELDYDLRGQGPPVVQLHGLTSSRHRDELLGLNLTRDLQDFAVLRYDARGHGHSSGRANPREYQWDSLADDLLQLTEAVCGPQPLHAVGPSMGTGTLLHAVVRAPQRFTSLTLVIPPTAWASRVAQAGAYATSANLVSRYGIEAFLRVNRGLTPPPAVSPRQPETAPEVPESLLPSVFRGAADTDLPSHDKIAQLRIPTLILAWVDDPSHPLSTADTLHELITGSTLSVARTPQDTKRWPSLVAEHLADQRIDPRRVADD